MIHFDDFICGFLWKYANNLRLSYIFLIKKCDFPYSWKEFIGMLFTIYINNNNNINIFHE